MQKIIIRLMHVKSLPLRPIQNVKQMCLFYILYSNCILKYEKEDLITPIRKVSSDSSKEKFVLYCTSFISALDLD